MPSGGARHNAGRKKGSATKRTRAIADRASEDGVMPLEVMLTAMRAAWEQRVEPAQLATAVMIAEKCAPYLHPKLSSVDQTMKGTLGYINVPTAERDPFDAMDAAAGASGAGDPKASRH